VAAVIAALIQAGGDGAPEPPPDPPVEESVAINSVTFLSRDPPLLVRIIGTAAGVAPFDDIHVVARPSSASAAAADAPGGAASGEEAQQVAEWIALKAAREGDDGVWEVDLRVPAEESRPLEFFAVIYEGPGSAREGHTVGGPDQVSPSQTRGCETEERSSDPVPGRGSGIIVPARLVH